jgi:prephenate dehydrogenase
MEREQTPPVRPPHWTQISIVGLGLIGGSVACALRERLPHVRLVGIERESVAGGSTANLVDTCLSELDEPAVAQAFAGSELIFLATPVSSIRRWLAAALAHPGLVTDCGSTKRDIVEAARALPGSGRFVPGHPMAGSAGHGSAAADLFEGRPWMLCPEGVDAGAVQAVEELVALFGARPVRISAADHDRAVAWTSHTPRLVASALAVLAEREGALAAAGPAFERLLRSSGGAPGVWADVLGSNADEVARALRLLIAELEACGGREPSPSGALEQSLATLAAADQVLTKVEGENQQKRS